MPNFAKLWMNGDMSSQAKHLAELFGRNMALVELWPISTVK